MTMPENTPLIVGAGPVGLAAALFLARRGIRARIIEKEPEPSKHSKALAVNPRTLDLLEPSGVTARMLDRGKRITGATLHDGGRVAAELDFAALRHRYPWMLALSQAASEALLAEAVAEQGIAVERRVRLVNCRTTTHSGVRATLEHADATQTDLDCPWLLAADGAHSTVRRALGIGFPGTTFAREWILADVPLDARLDPDRAHLCFVDGGFLFLIRVVAGDGHDDASRPVWRVMGNLSKPLERLVHADVVGEPVWQSSFRIAHRMAERMREGRIYLAGDAAHIHSPAGARGMNLGIEDAWVFAALASHNQLGRYHATRHAVDRSVVRRIDLLTRVMRGESRTARVMRSSVLPMLLRLRPLRRRVVTTTTGLDHELDKFTN